MTDDVAQPADRPMYPVGRPVRGSNGQPRVTALPMSQSRVVHVDCDELAREVRAALLGRDEEEGCAVPLAEIVTLSIKPMDVVPGDYVHRKGKKSLKIVAPPKRMGMVVRLCGVTTDIGHAVDYVEHQLDVMITRGYPVATLPEHDRFGKDQR